MPAQPRGQVPRTGSWGGGRGTAGGGRVTEQRLAGHKAALLNTQTHILMQQHYVFCIVTSLLSNAYIYLLFLKMLSTFFK